MTLVELLVVVMIVVLLVAAALPLAKPAFKDHKIREASRQVAGFIMGAQARAAEIGRPVGVWIERDNYTTANGAARALRLFLAETPPPYVGDAIGARAYIEAVGDPNPNPAIKYYSIRFPVNAGSVNILTQVGDEIKFDYKGLSYAVVSTPASPPYNIPSTPVLTSVPVLFIQADVNDPQPVVSTPPASASPTLADYNRAGLPFQIYRQPSRSAAAPLELANGICLDLTVSGITAGGLDFAPHVIDTSTPLSPPNSQPDAQDGINYRPIVVMFRPTGGVEQSYWAAPQSQGTNFVKAYARGDFHFLVGRTEQVYDYNPTVAAKTIPDLFTNTSDAKSNIMDLTTVWVSIGGRTGVVRTSENADSTGAMAGQKIQSARRFTRSTLEMGGR